MQGPVMLVLHIASFIVRNIFSEILHRRVVRRIFLNIVEKILI